MIGVFFCSIILASYFVSLLALSLFVSLISGLQKNTRVSLNNNLLK